MIRCLSIAVLLLLAACGPSELERERLAEQAKMEAAARERVLVSAEWLVENMSDPNLRILALGEVSSVFDSAHIPGARFIDWTQDITDPEFPQLFSILPQQQFEALMSDLGIQASSRIVIYDTLDSRLSTRLFWTLRYYGHPDIKILDGGKAAWATLGVDFVTGETEVIQTDYKVTMINQRYLTDKGFIESNLGQKNMALLDGRPHKQYTGEVDGKVFHTGVAHQAKGHIYGAQNVPWKQNFKADGTFKSAAELRKLYQPHGVTEDKTIVTYCNEGLHASPPWFVLSELLGYPDVRLYDNSMAEWANLPGAHLVMGEHCM